MCSSDLSLPKKFEKLASVALYPALCPIKFESSAYGKCLVENIPYLTSGTKFDNVNATGRWWFTNMPVTFDPNTATYWLSGTAPNNSRYDGWNPNGQAPFLQLGTRRP